MLALAIAWLVFAITSPCPADEPKAKPRITLHLDSSDVLLGEPILVERRVEVDGPGVWEEPVGQIRGMARAGGFFLMRHEDGSWVADTWEGVEPSVFGGIGGTAKVTKDEPYSKWEAVQEWCAVDRPGKYTLYAIGWGVDPVPNLDPPLADDVKAKIQATGRKGEVVRFTLTISEGARKTRRAMVHHWTRVAKDGNDKRSDAARTAMAYIRQDDFLPELTRRLQTAQISPGEVYLGLALRGDARSIDLIFQHPGWDGIEFLRYLRPSQVSVVIPRLIDRLTDPDHTSRAQAEELLRGWTGQSFGHTWDGYNSMRPTLEEGRAMQPMYRDWWEKNKEDFRPKFRLR